MQAEVVREVWRARIHQAGADGVRGRLRTAKRCKRGGAMRTVGKQWPERAVDGHYPTPNIDQIESENPESNG
jgi:hypothetical protein